MTARTSSSKRSLGARNSKASAAGDKPTKQVSTKSEVFSAPSASQKNDDSKYEFNAPKFHDFLSSEDVESNADAWFGEGSDLEKKISQLHNHFEKPRTYGIVCWNTLYLPIADKHVTSPQRDSLAGEGASTYFPPVKCPNIDFDFMRSAQEPQAENKPTANIAAKPSKSKSLTVPKTFKAAAKRQQKTQKESGGLGVKSEGVKKRTGTGGIKKRPGDLTIPKPFQFHKTLKQAVQEQLQQPKSPFVPLAARVKQFERKTPPRFRTKVAKPAASKEPTKLTQPKSPRLMTRLRAKQETIPTTEELELQKLKNVEPFKARPLNRKIFEASRPVGVPEPKKQAVTVPQSPAITKPKPPPEKEPSPPRIPKANPIRSYPAVEPVREHRFTEPEDFQLPGSEISERKKRQFEQKLEKEKAELEKARRFVAKPAVIKPPSLPAPAPITVTEPEPFELMTEVRGVHHKLTMEEKLMEEERLKKESANFKARPLQNPVPFVPKKSSKQLTVSEEVFLHTDVRAEERKAFDEEIECRQKLLDELSQRIKQQEEEKEKEEVQALRQQMVPHAQPIRQYRPVQIRPSMQPLTEPRSPMIGEKRKRLQKPKQKIL
ncbi:Protein tpx2 [Quaeritorhiza haematococci]|nr:Protein tpx2 [Quaeritorhiza haematococci]